MHQAVREHPAYIPRLAGQAFEVASIRPHTAPLHTIMGRTISGPRVTLEGYTIPQLIMEAYGLKGIWQLSLTAVSGQSDLLNVYYDIAARAPGETAITKDESRKMLQTLLDDRFHLISCSPRRYNSYRSVGERARERLGGGLALVSDNARRHINDVGFSYNKRALCVRGARE